VRIDRDDARVDHFRFCVGESLAQHHVPGPSGCSSIRLTAVISVAYGSLGAKFRSEVQLEGEYSVVRTARGANRHSQL
jgi:hypothetical protein